MNTYIFYRTRLLASSALLGLIFCVVAPSWAGTEILCDFNGLAVGEIDGQDGWDVYDKVKDSSACSVATEVGTTEERWDRALIIKRSNESIRCVTDRPARWLRQQTLFLEFDFRFMVPDEARSKEYPALSVLVGNTVLSENVRWGIELRSTTNATWKLVAALPDEASVELASETIGFSRGESVRISDWLHCRISILKETNLDSFDSKVELFDSEGVRLAVLACTDENKEDRTQSIWSLSRVHAGFLASSNMEGLCCIDNFRLYTQP